MSSPISVKRPESVSPSVSKAHALVAVGHLVVVLFLDGVVLAREALECPSEVDTAAPFSHLVGQGRSLLDRGCRPAVADLADHLLIRAESDFGRESLEVADALDLLTESRFWLLVRSDAEIDYARRALRIRQQQPDGGPSALAKSHLNLGAHLGAKLLDLSRAVEALKHFEQARLLWEKEVGVESAEVADLLTWFVELLEDWGAEGGNRARELPWIAELLDLETTAGKSILDTIEDLDFGKVIPDIVAKDPALAIALRSVALARAVDESSPAYAECLNVVGKVLYHRQLYDETLAAFTRGLEVRKAIHPTNLSQVSRAYHNRGDALMMVGELEEAREHIEKSLEMRFALSGERFASTLELLGELHFLTGDLEEAVKLYREALPGLEETYGGHYYFEGLIGLADTYEELGEVDEAERWYLKALDVLRDLERVAAPEVGSATPKRETAVVQAKLGALLASSGKREAGQELLEAARETQESLLVRPLEDYALTLRGLAEVARGDRDAKRAWSLLRDSASVLAEYEGDHPRLIDTWLVTAEVELDLELPTAEQTLDQVTDFLPRLGENAYLARARHDLLRARLVAPTDREQALVHAVSAAYLYARHLAPAFRVLPAESALRYALENRKSLYLALTLLADSTPTQESVLLVWEAVAHNRGLVGAELEQRHRWARHGSDPRLLELLTTLNDARQFMAETQLRSRRASIAHDRETQLAWAQTRMRVAEQAFVEKAATTARPGATAEPLRLANLASELPEGSALVSFVRFEGTGLPDRSVRYGAFVAKAGTSEFHFVDLGPADDLDRLVREWRSFLFAYDGRWTHAESMLRRKGLELRQAMWDPLIRFTGAARRFFVVPDGSLFFIPLAALPGRSDGSYLIEEGYETHRLVSERDLLRRRRRPPRPRSLLAIGGPDFDLGVTSRALAELRRRPSLLERWRESASEIFQELLRDPCRGGATIDFLELSAARKEVAEIASIFSSGSEKNSVTMLSAAAATESAFKEHAPMHSVLHVATHAFFDLECGKRESRGLGELLVEAPGDSPAIPGLAFAGANRIRDPFTAEDDGILTLPEIANLDLSGADWVVLSACETALGKVAAGEGVLGLARSFRIAGADTLILSLWPVSDSATKEWMIELYRARFSRGESTSTSLRTASLTVLEARRRTERSTHPFYWAAFVAMGGWE